MIINLFDETGKLPDNLNKVIIDAAKASVVSVRDSERCSVDILIVDLENMHIINRDKRGIDAPTDVLSFPSGDLAYSGTLFLGDIVIAYEKIFSQAEEYGHSPEREAGFLTAHAMLHLVGYDHESPEEESKMLEKQEAILSELGLKR